MTDTFLTKEKKSELIKQFGKTAMDTGSTEVQVAILTQRINYLTEHLKTHRKDFAGRLGLLKLVGQRKRLLAYLRKNSENSYQKLIQDLSLRK